MKARSLILTHVQMPHRFIGLPPLVALALFMLFVSLAMAGLVLGFGGTGFFGGLGVVIFAWGYIQARLRRDPHAFGVGWMQAAFWKGRAAGSRVFLAGSAKEDEPGDAS